MSWLRVEIGEGRPGGRVYVHGHRLHHGLVGFGAVVIGTAAGGVPGVALALTGCALMWHDRHDFPWCWHNEPFRFDRYHRH